MCNTISKRRRLPVSYWSNDYELLGDRQNTSHYWLAGCVLSSGIRPWFEHSYKVQLLGNLRLGCQIGKDGSRQSAAGEVREETWLPLKEEKNLVASSLIWSSCLFQHGAWFFSHKFEWTRISCTAYSSSFSSFKKKFLFFFLPGR